MQRDELTEPLKKGFRRIFFRLTEQGEERLSVVKLTLFAAYLLANILTYLQFATLTDLVPQLRLGSQATGITVLEYQIPMTSYGELAHYLNFLVLVGAVFFFLTQDKPLLMWVRRIRDWASQSPLHLIGAIVGSLSIGAVSVLLGQPILRLGLAPFALGVSYYFGLFMVIAWAILQPILFLGGSLLLVNTLAHKEHFQKRFGNLAKPQRKTAELLLLDLLLAAVIILFAITVFKVTHGAPAPELGTITQVAGIEFNQTSIYHLVLNLEYLLILTGLNLIVLGFVHVWKRSRAVGALILGSLFIAMFLIILVEGYSQLAPVEDPSAILIITGIIAIVSLLLFLGPLSFVRFVLKKSRDPAYLNSRAALVPWILFAGMLLAVLKTAPVLLPPIGQLSTLSNVLDVLGLFFSLLFGVIRVTTITEHPTSIKGTPHSRNPLKWVKRVQMPAYSKVLAFFYLAFIGFYLSLETNAIGRSLNIPNDFRMFRLEFLQVASLFGLLWVFWRYKPLTQTDTIITEQNQG